MTQMTAANTGDSSLTREKNQSKKHYNLFVALIAAVGGALFGFDTAVIAGALIFIKQTMHPSIMEQELVVSMVVLGAFLGCILSGKLTNRLGRKRLLIYTSWLFIIGTALCTLAPGVYSLIIGRFILGIAVGMASYSVPLFIAEISLPEKRGAMVLLNGLFLTGGQAAAFLICYFFALHFSSEISWRLMLGFAMIPAVILLFGMIFAPASPRWLLMKGKKDEARKVLNKIRDADKVERELHEIEESFSHKENGIKELFSKRVRPVLLIGLVIGIGQQFAGINTVMYYGPEIFKQVGFQGAHAQIFATFGMGLVNFLFTIVCIFTVDKLGRRTLLLTGTLGAAICLLTLGAVMKAGVASVPGGQVIAVISLVCYIAFYCISLGSLFWLIIAEIYPLDVRGVGMSFVAGVQWMANFVVASTFLTVLHTFGGGTTFWIYAGACLFLFVYVLLFVPETKGISLETIETNLKRGTPSRQLGEKYSAKPVKIASHIVTSN
ncbi:sugar porter family MFS transporter [Dongshaea marina]|uniref:sugar porter family MFS transporter n=1 Tax=Dongshaea marina TaxID=2047966 RepID=UPI0018FF7FE9|nr:sugar porter family MFS transporter [Dongshaea marina]